MPATCYFLNQKNLNKRFVWTDSRTVLPSGDDGNSVGGLVAAGGSDKGGGLVNGGGLANGGGTVNGGGLVAGGGLVTGGGSVAGGGLVNSGGLVAGGGIVNGGGSVNGGGLVAGEGSINGGGSIADGGFVTDKVSVIGEQTAVDLVDAEQPVSKNSKLYDESIETESKNGQEKPKEINSKQVESVDRVKLVINLNKDYNFLLDTKEETLAVDGEKNRKIPTKYSKRGTVDQTALTTHKSTTLYFKDSWACIDFNNPNDINDERFKSPATEREKKVEEKRKNLTNFAEDQPKRRQPMNNNNKTLQICVRMVDADKFNCFDTNRESPDENHRSSQPKGIYNADEVSTEPTSNVTDGLCDVDSCRVDENNLNNNRVERHAGIERGSRYNGRGEKHCRKCSYKRSQIQAGVRLAMKNGWKTGKKNGWNSTMKNERTGAEKDGWNGAKKDGCNSPRFASAARNNGAKKVACCQTEDIVVTTKENLSEDLEKMPNDCEYSKANENLLKSGKDLKNKSTEFENSKMHKTLQKFRKFESCRATPIQEKTCVAGNVKEIDIKEECAAPLSIKKHVDRHFIRCPLRQTGADFLKKSPLNAEDSPRISTSRTVDYNQNCDTKQEIYTAPRKTRKSFDRYSCKRQLRQTDSEIVPRLPLKADVSSPISSSRTVDVLRKLRYRHNKVKLEETDLINVGFAESIISTSSLRCFSDPEPYGYGSSKEFRRFQKDKQSFLNSVGRFDQGDNLYEGKLETTLVVLKNDLIRLKLVGKIIRTLEKKGLQILALKYTIPNRNLLEKHFKSIKCEPHCESLIEELNAAPVVAMALIGVNAIDITNFHLGGYSVRTSSTESTIADFFASNHTNLCICSSNKESAGREIKLWFHEQNFKYKL